jgi:hypothetical protein
MQMSAALDQTGHSWISSLSSMELQTTIRPRALVQRDGVRRETVRDRLSCRALGDRIISCIGKLSKSYEGSSIHVHPPRLASYALCHLSSHERSQCRGLLCEYRLVDHNWNLVGTDNELERARNEYPTRRRY